MRIIKRVGKDFHVYDGTEIIAKTDCFDDAVSLLPKDDKVYKSSVDSELEEWSNEKTTNLKIQSGMDYISNVKSVYEFKKVISKAKK